MATTSERVRAAGLTRTQRALSRLNSEDTVLSGGYRRDVGRDTVKALATEYALPLLRSPGNGRPSPPYGASGQTNLDYHGLDTCGYGYQKDADLRDRLSLALGGLFSTGTLRAGRLVVDLRPDPGFPELLELAPFESASPVSVSYEPGLLVVSAGEGGADVPWDAIRYELGAYVLSLNRAVDTANRAIYDALQGWVARCPKEAAERRSALGKKWQGAMQSAEQERGALASLLAEWVERWAAETARRVAVEEQPEVTVRRGPAAPDGILTHLPSAGPVLAGLEEEGRVWEVDGLGPDARQIEAELDGRLSRWASDHVHALYRLLVRLGYKPARFSEVVMERDAVWSHPGLTFPASSARPHTDAGKRVAAALSRYAQAVALVVKVEEEGAANDRAEVQRQATDIWRAAEERAAGSTRARPPGPSAGNEPRQD